jgi:hypothetical protein
MSKTITEILAWELRAPRPLRDAWARWIQRLPPEFWPRFERFKLVARFLIGCGVVASQLYMAHLSFAGNKPAWGCFQGTFAILYGAYLMIVFERKFREAGL